jgi:hypothetical protein
MGSASNPSSAFALGAARLGLGRRGEAGRRLETATNESNRPAPDVHTAKFIAR